MPQEFQVLRCYKCFTFQVHQVKKSTKYNCKLCGEKQSIKKVFGRGSGADCRRHVQKCNMTQGEVKEMVAAAGAVNPRAESSYKNEPVGESVAHETNENIDIHYAYNHKQEYPHYSGSQYAEDLTWRNEDCASRLDCRAKAPKQRYMNTKVNKPYERHCADWQTEGSSSVSGPQESVHTFKYNEAKTTPFEENDTSLPGNVTSPVAHEEVPPNFSQKIGNVPLFNSDTTKESVPLRMWEVDLANKERKGPVFTTDDDIDDLIKDF